MLTAHDWDWKRICNSGVLLLLPQLLLLLLLLLCVTSTVIVTLHYVIIMDYSPRKYGTAVTMALRGPYKNRR
jgi:hypothetical protein